MNLYSSLTAGKVGRHLCFLMINHAFKIMKSGRKRPIQHFVTFWVQGWSERFDWLLVGPIGRKIFSKMPLRPPLKLESQFNLGSLALFWFTGWIQLTHMFPSLGSPDYVHSHSSPFPLDLCCLQVPMELTERVWKLKLFCRWFLWLLFSDGSCQRRDTEHLWL